MLHTASRRPSYRSFSPAGSALASCTNSAAITNKPKNQIFAIHPISSPLVFVLFVPGTNVSFRKRKPHLFSGRLRRTRFIRLISGYSLANFQSGYAVLFLVSGVLGPKSICSPDFGTFADSPGCMLYDILLDPALFYELPMVLSKPNPLLICIRPRVPER